MHQKRVYGFDGFHAGCLYGNLSAGRMALAGATPAASSQRRKPTVKQNAKFLASSRPKIGACVECGRPVENTEDEICQKCWDGFVQEKNAERQTKIAAGWQQDATGAIFPPPESWLRNGRNTHNIT